VQFADGTAATFAAAAVIGGILGITVFRGIASWFGSPLFLLTAGATVVVTMFGMVSAGSHSHAGGHGHGETETAAHEHGGGGAGGGGEGHGVGVVIPPKKYDPTQPIDLGGVEGVSPEQQARAENLLSTTIYKLPQWADYRTAEAKGFISIGDGFTGNEHFVNTAYFEDDHILDPDYPESLVYDVDQATGKRTLASAMYMLPESVKLADVPDVGGKLTQWHIHNNLCFTLNGKVAGLTDANGTCSAPLVKGPENAMIHVWIRPHPCGPFAALEGVGAGQTLEGTEKLCDTAHGH
jgi:hypothetical protein